MANLISEKLIRTGKPRESQTVRQTYCIYDRTTKPKLVNKGLNSIEDVEEEIKKYMEKNPRSFLVILKETIIMEVVRIT